MNHRVHTDLTVYSPDGHYFEPFVAEDGRVGYRVVRQSDYAETYIYLNPSSTDDARKPCVFAYVGGDNDPAVDAPATFLMPDWDTR
jgi:hypothetical protein